MSQQPLLTDDKTGHASFDVVRRLQAQVREFGACSLPGVSIDYLRFMPIMWKAVSRGFVSHENAAFVSCGLWHGFDCGLDVSLLKGRRRYRNYKSALEGRSRVSKATRVRVGNQKTLMLCGVPSGYDVASLGPLIPFDHWRIFPIGAVPKPLEPEELRPVSDHSKTGLKEATVDLRLKHTLTAVEDIEREFKFAYSMIVGDVDAAYPLLPLAWWVWKYFMFVWFDVREPDEATGAELFLYMHVCGDFGTSGLPGTFKIFFTDVVVNMARSELVLTLPMPIFVDDMGLIGAVTAALRREWEALKVFLRELGVPLKELKERLENVRQLMLGFWWDSIQRTRTLDRPKLEQYIAMFDDFSRRKTLSLTEMQSSSGRMQRACMTLPPGSNCMLASVYALMSGLTLGFQKRRTTRVVRADFAGVRDLLQQNMGRGYFSYDRFQRAPRVWSDASKSRRYTGGGYVSECGAYRWWTYGGSAAREPIDFLEGDAVVLAAQDLGAGWYRCVVPMYIDNTAFQKSAVKGWSKADRLHRLLRILFSLSLTYECVFEFHWLSTHVNVHADLLSRENGEAEFLTRVYADGIWSIGPCKRHAESGKVRCLGKGYSADVAGDHPRRTAPEFVMAVTFPRASVFEGLPTELFDTLGDYMDSRLKESSMRTVNAAMVHWRKVALRYGWQVLMLSDDPHRGGKMAAFVLEMAKDTDLAYGSISKYVWGLRTWTKSERQVDPLFGVYDWQDFMTSVHVKTWSVGEPRRAIPLDLLRKALQAVDLTVFWEVQMALFVVLYLFGFSRSEHPCPKTYNSFDADQNAMVRDIQLVTWRGVTCIGIRLKVIKQDPRMERPEASGGEDWVYVGDVEDPDFSPTMWLRRVYAFHGQARALTDPFFVDTNRVRVLTYGAAMKHFRTLLARVSDWATAMLYGLHCLRVSGWNGARQGPAGEECAVAHGGWHGGSQRRYDRFGRDEILGLPAAILGAPAHVFDDVPVPGALLVPRVPVARTAPAPVAQPASSRGISSKGSSKGWVWSADDGPGPPHGSRCSNYVCGCTVAAINGVHAGVPCNNLLMTGKRTRG